MTRYVVMANGRGIRWGEHLGMPKHLIEYDGETLLRRIVRQVTERDPGSEIIISSKDPRYDTEGARRHAPAVNELELDRFVPELITDDVCFLYGDTLYSNAAIERIVRTSTDEMRFLGNERGIVAVRVGDGELMNRHLDHVRRLFLAGEIESCRGWQLYQSYAGQAFGEVRLEYGFTLMAEPTVGFNTPEEFEAFAQNAEAFSPLSDSARR